MNTGSYFSPSTVAGIALAGGGTKFEVADGALGSGDSDVLQVGAFMQQGIGEAYLRATVAYGRQNISTERTVIILGSDQLRADFNTDVFSGRLEGGYRFATKWAALTPYAAGQLISYDLPAYAEWASVGSNLFALNYAADTVTVSRSEVGLRAERSLAFLVAG